MHQPDFKIKSRVYLPHFNEFLSIACYVGCLMAVLMGGTAFLASTSLQWNGQPAPSQPIPKKIPVIDVTDLYHPYQDPGDNFDLILPYALPELDLRAIILDVTDAFRKPVADHPTLWPDPRGPREAGIVPIMQLNYIFGRQVPFAMGPFTAMRSPEDKMMDAPGIQQEGIQLLLQTLRASKEPVHLLSFGSARIVAVAYNRDPALFRQKVKLIHLSAGTAAPNYQLGTDKGANAIPGGEWNVALDVHAFLRLLRSDLPIALYPCAMQDGAFAYSPNNSYWQMPDLNFVREMDPKLRSYLRYAFNRTLRPDFLRAMDETEWADTTVNSFPKPHHVWETAVWTQVMGRKLVKRANGQYRLIRADEGQPGDQLLANSLRPCKIQTRDDGRFTYQLTTQSSNIMMYDRGDAKENERAFREALPVLYKSLHP